MGIQSYEAMRQKLSDLRNRMTLGVAKEKQYAETVHAIAERKEACAAAAKLKQKELRWAKMSVAVFTDIIERASMTGRGEESGETVEDRRAVVTEALKRHILEREIEAKNLKPGSTWHRAPTAEDENVVVAIDDAEDTFWVGAYRYLADIAGLQLVAVPCEIDQADIDGNTHRGGDPVRNSNKKSAPLKEGEYCWFHKPDPRGMPPGVTTPTLEEAHGKWHVVARTRQWLLRELELRQSVEELMPLCSGIAERDEAIAELKQKRGAAEQKVREQEYTTAQLQAQWNKERHNMQKQSRRAEVALAAMQNENAQLRHRLEISERKVAELEATLEEKEAALRAAERTIQQMSERMAEQEQRIKHQRIEAAARERQVFYDKEKARRVAVEEAFAAVEQHCNTMKCNLLSIHEKFKVANNVVQEVVDNAERAERRQEARGGVISDCMADMFAMFGRLGMADVDSSGVLNPHTADD